MRRFAGRCYRDGRFVSVEGRLHSIQGLQIFLRGFVANAKEIVPCAVTTDENVYHAQCVAAAYRRHGDQLSKFVTGEYAAAIYDASKRSLFLAHDTLGIIPLYYRESRDEIVFASHLDSIAPRGSGFKLDEEYIADYLSCGDHHGDRTPYSQIKRLAAGVSVTYVGGALRRHNCWLISEKAPLLYRNPGDYEAQLRALIKEAVDTAIPTQGVTWCELSGGLDSSTVMTSAVQTKRAQGLHAVSFVYPDSRTADESNWIRIAAGCCGVPSCTVNGDTVRPFSEFPSGFSAQPYHALINAARYRLYGSLLDQHSVSVVLTGMGGDATLLGDGPEPYFLADLLRRGRWIAFLRTLRRWIEECPEKRPALYWLRRCVAIPSLRRLKNRIIQDQPPKISWLANDYQRGARRNGKPRRSWVPSNPADVAESWFLERLLRCSNIVSLWDYTDSMRVQFRHPLMYLPLIEFMLSIPWDIKLGPSVDRTLQRRAFAHVLPPKIVQRTTKAGPDQAIYAGLGGSKQWLRLLTETPLISQRGYVDKVRWARAVELAKVGRCESIKHFVAAATLEFWLRQLEGPLPLDEVAQ